MKVILYTQVYLSSIFEIIEDGETATILAGLFSFTTIVFVLFAMMSSEIQKKLILRKTSSLVRYRLYIIFSPFAILSFFIVLTYISSWFRSIICFSIFLLSFTLYNLLISSMLLEPIYNSRKFIEKIIRIESRKIIGEFENKSISVIEERILMIENDIFQAYDLQHEDGRLFSSQNLELSTMDISKFFKDVFIKIDKKSIRDDFLLEFYKTFIERMDDFDMRFFGFSEYQAIKIELISIFDNKTHFHIVADRFCSNYILLKNTSTNEDMILLVRILYEKLTENPELIVELKSHILKKANALMNVNYIVDILTTLAISSKKDGGLSAGIQERFSGAIEETYKGIELSTDSRVWKSIKERLNENDF